MSTVKTSAIIVKANPYKEHDKLLTLFTLDRGKIIAVCKKARHTINRWSSSFEPPIFCNIQMYEKNQFYTLTEISTIESFLSISSILKSAVAFQCIAFTINKFTMLEMENNSLFYLLLSTLHILEKKMCSPSFACSYFNLQFLKESGFALNFSKCVSCGKAFTGEMFSFSQWKNALFCETCTKKNHIFPSFKIDLKEQLEKIYYCSLNNIEENHYGHFLFNYSEIDRIIKELFKGFLSADCLTVSQFENY
ncbi:MAG: DNA repair protein RecO [Caldisericia bacterium]|nr:DNA repair protein RecO [Caldisericia bacterium]